jgi:4'-phosphopantetheinyl transferase
VIIYYTTSFSSAKGESRRLLTEAVSEYTGDRERAETLSAGIRTGEKGKPYIDGFDFFSVSHTGNVWAVLICGSECGLDIQLRRKCREISIAEKFYHPDDAAAVAAAREEDAQKGSDIFLRLWARREALVKAAGGSVADTGIPSVLKDRASYGGIDYSIKDICIPGIPELFAALCVKGGGSGPEILRLE